jgi:hypothetical protein
MEQSIEIMQENVHHLQNLLNCDPFVLVLIDGNDIAFRDSFLYDGEVGGRRAARKLHQAVNEHVFSSIDDLPPETKVVVRVFADLDSLVQSCISRGMISTGAKVKGFTLGFCQDKALFDMINVGSRGRDAVIDKIEGQYPSSARTFLIVLTHK